MRSQLGSPIRRSGPGRSPHYRRTATIHTPPPEQPALSAQPHAVLPLCRATIFLVTLPRYIVFTIYFVKKQPASPHLAGDNGRRPSALGRDPRLAAEAALPGPNSNTTKRFNTAGTREATPNAPAPRNRQGNKNKRHNKDTGCSALTPVVQPVTSAQDGTGLQGPPCRPAQQAALAPPGSLHAGAVRKWLAWPGCPGKPGSL